MSQLSVKKTDERMKLLDQVKEISGESTNSKAIDSALRHYIESKENMEDIAREIPPETAEKLNTSELKLSYYPKVR